MIVAIRVTSTRETDDTILAATPEAGEALNLVHGKSPRTAQFEAFATLAAICEKNPSQRPEWRSSDGRAFTLANIGMALPGEATVALIRLTPVRSSAPGTSGLWRSALQFGLSAREATVYELLASGASDKKIGEVMKISRHTARSHIRNIYRKLGVAGRVEAVGKMLHLPNPPAVPPA